MAKRNNLRQIVMSDKLAHAYLVTGGIEPDRLDLASYIAGTLLCREPESGEPCGRCYPCTQLDSGNCPDFHLLEPQGASIRIHQVRELEKKLIMRSFQGGAKIAVISRGDTLTEAAGNCLLKILEDPPEDTYFIFTAEQSELMLATIRSRCQELRLKEPKFKYHEEETYWTRIIKSDLSVLLLEILPKIEKEPDIKAVLQRMALACRDQMALRLTGRENLLLQSEAGLPLYLTPLQLWRCFRSIDNTRALLERNANRRLALEVLIFKLHRHLNQGDDSGGYRYRNKV